MHNKKQGQRRMQDAAAYPSCQTGSLSLNISSKKGLFERRALGPLRPNLVSPDGSKIPARQAPLFRHIGMVIVGKPYHIDGVVRAHRSTLLSQDMIEP